MDAATIMFYGNRTFMGALDGLELAFWSRPNVCGVWSVKDIVSHMAAYELLTSDILGTFSGATEKPMFDLYAATYQTWNDDMVAARKHLSAEASLAEYTAAYDEKMARAKAIAPDVISKVGAIPWYGESYALDDYIVYADYGHKREHAAQIMVFRDSLKSRG